MTTWTRMKMSTTKKTIAFTWENMNALGGTRTPNL